MTCGSRILVIGPSWVGDMVMTQSLFKLLKSQDANCVIDVVAPLWSLPVLSRMPEVNQTIPLDIPHGKLNFYQRYQLAKSLRANHYDQAIIIPRSIKSALIPWLAHIPKRTGWLGESRYFLLNDWRRLRKADYPMMVQRLAALALPPATPLPEFEYPSLKVTPTEIEATLAQLGLTRTDQPILILCPGAEFGSAKRWPVDYYAELARHYHAKQWQVWILGSAKERELVDNIDRQSSMVCEKLAGKTTLTQSIDLLSQATIVVSNDSGLMHIAASLDVPLIGLYGATSSLYTPPLSKFAKKIALELPCSPCAKRTCPLGHHACMREIKTQMVIDAITSMTKATMTSTPIESHPIASTA